MAKKKARLDNLRALVQALTASFRAFLLSCPALVSCFGSPALLLSCLGSLTCFFSLLSYPETPTTLFSRLVLPLIPGSPAVLLPLPVLNPTPSHFLSTALRKFK